MTAKLRITAYFTPKQCTDMETASKEDGLTLAEELRVIVDLWSAWRFGPKSPTINRGRK